MNKINKGNLRVNSSALIKGALGVPGLQPLLNHTQDGQHSSQKQNDGGEYNRTGPTNNNTLITTRIIIEIF